MRKIYTETVKLENKKAQENGYKDLSDLWIEDFEDKHFEENMDQLYLEVLPFYKNLHAYVRRILFKTYGQHYPSTISKSSIPAHLLGNMWAQSWENVLDLVMPFKNAPKVDLTKALLDKNYTPLKMFKVRFNFTKNYFDDCHLIKNKFAFISKESENFFTSLGLFKMTDKFWEFSMIEKPLNRQGKI